jgi:Protein kinase domain
MDLPQNLEIVLAVLLAGVGIALIVTVFAYVVIPIIKGFGWLVTHLLTFVAREVGDTLRIVGGTITTVVFVPLVLLSILVGRWSSAAHYGRSIQGEIGAIARAIYRIVIGNPARLFCMTALVDGLEQRVPAALAAAPGADRPSKSKAGQFEGYKIVGSLPGGGSGGRLFVAEPDEFKQAVFARQNLGDIRQVVIKTFSLRDGSSLPQIVRESRALEAAKKLGLVLDHELTDDRFFYIMRYVPGESMGLVTQRLHAQAGGGGLGPMQLRSVLGYAADLLTTLDQYHRGGLWHKDVKPDNIIVDGRHAHLVDFGLVTPLRSGMTLTTHGTEYFRDPEMVRMALKGVKVHQVDGAKFDLYAAGAVMFSMIENSFPAHGGLSQLSKPCPEAVRWIIRRAMTDYERRYATASAMLADLGVVLAASDPHAVKPADLPSVRDDGAGVLPPVMPQDAIADQPRIHAPPIGARPRSAPRARARACA